MIVELMSKSGRVLNVHNFDKNKVTIGRGYNNDLILKDPYLDANHLEVCVDEDSGHFSIIDHSSLNGTRFKSVKTKLEPGQATNIAKGETVLAGKSYFRFIDKQQTVGTAIKTSKLEPVFTVISTWWICIVILATLAGLTYYAAYLINPFSNKLAQELVDVLYIAAATFIYGGIWVIIAKMQHLDGRFFFNVNLFLFVLCFDQAFELAVPILDFNIGWLFSIDIISIFCAFAFTALAVYLSCTQTLHVSSQRSILISSAIAMLLIASELSNIVFQPDFNNSPAYNMILTAPGNQLREGITEETFLEKVQTLNLQEN